MDIATVVGHFREDGQATTDTAQQRSPRFFAWIDGFMVMSTLWERFGIVAHENGRTLIEEVS